MRARIALRFCLIALLFHAGCSEPAKPDNANQVKPAASGTTGDHAADRQKVLDETQKKIADIQAAAPKTGEAGKTSNNWEQYSGAVDTRFVPADAFAVVVAYPARVLKLPAFAKLDLKDMYADMEKHMGFSLGDVDQTEMVFALSPPRAPLRKVRPPRAWRWRFGSASRMTARRL